MRLAELKRGLALVGLEPDRVCTVEAVVPHAENAVQVIYRLPDGAIKERLLGIADEATIEVATVERPWAFTATGKSLFSPARPSGSTWRFCSIR